MMLNRCSVKLLVHLLCAYSCFFAVQVEAQLANLYPHDIGIENDTNVLYVEKFDDGLPSVLSRYDETKNSAGMSLDTDVPPGSKDPRSLKITNVGGENTGGHLYKRFVPGFDSTVYLRYYVKYPAISRGYIHHEGVWIGGYNPAIPWPYPRAGICGLGDARISIAYEPVGQDSMNTYLYWGDMRHDPNNNCWGNVMILGDSTSHPVPFDQWLCVEIMVKLNNPVTAHNGELRIWHDGKEVGYWGAGFPNGEWTWDKFIIRNTASPFEGFRWRTDPQLNLNYIWIEYYDDKSPAGVSHYIKYDHIVIARKRIGMIYDPGLKVSTACYPPAMRLSPNPAFDKVNIQTNDTQREISIYDLLGNRVHINTAQGESLDITVLPNGMYTIEVTTNKGFQRAKLIKQ